MTLQANLLGLPREIRDIILQNAIPHREVTFGHTYMQRDAPRRYHGFGWDVLAPKSLQNDARAAASLLEPFSIKSNQPTVRAPTASEIRTDSKGTSASLILSCRQLQAEVTEFLYAQTRFRFWSIFALMSFLYCVGDNAGYLREVFLRVELKWTHQPDVSRCRIDLQYLLQQAAHRLAGLRHLELVVWMDQLECLPGNWSERRPEDADAPMGLQEMFSPLKQITTLDHVSVVIQTRTQYKPAYIHGEFLKIKEELEDGLKRYLDPNHVCEESEGSQESLDRSQSSDRQDGDPLLRKESNPSNIASDDEDDDWSCCSQQ